MAEVYFNPDSHMACAHCGDIFPRPRSARDASRRKYCGQKCSLDALHESLRVPLKDRFWCHVDAKDHDQCWPWLRYLDPKGYGVTPGDDRKRIFAHRAAYMLTHGEIPKGMVVRHSCDNPPCCNPNHLSVGTQAENIADMMARQRHTSTKIPLDVARKMQEDFMLGLSTKEIAQKYSFGRDAVKNLMKRGRSGSLPPIPEIIRRANGIKNQAMARSQRIEVDGVVYASVEAARVALKRATRTIKRMIESGEAKYV